MSDLDGIRLHRVTCCDDMMELKRWMGERRPVLGIDTETGGFDWWRRELRYVQLGDAMTGWAIPFDDWSGVCKELITPYERPIVFHNYKFDVIFLEVNGVTVPRRHLHDSEVLVHLNDSTEPKALKLAASNHIDRGFAAGQQKLDEVMSAEGWTWANIPLDYPAYWQYAALDPVMTARLWEMFEHHTHLPIYDIEIRCTDVLMRAERRGYRLDVDYIERMIPTLRGYAGDLREWAKGAYGVANLTSDAQVRKVLLADGWEPRVFTDSGLPSLKKEVAQHINHPLARAMMECKHSEKVAGAYLENFLEYSYEGRVHAKINPLGARTGRMSVSEPALQQLPRDDTVARDAFIPSEGNRLILCDYDQVEARLMVHFGHADTLRGLFGGAVDFFTGMARQIYNVPEMVKSDPRRSFAKNGVYAKIYGAGPERFAGTVGVPLEEGEAFLSMLDATYPEIRALQDEVDRVAKQRRLHEGGAYVDTPYGRRHKLGDREGIYKLLNYLIQGTAGDILKRKTVELDAAGVADYLVLPVHDELDFDVPAELVPDVSRTIEAVMPELGFDVPITVGIDVVDRWGDKYRQ